MTSSAPKRGIPPAGVAAMGWRHGLSRPRSALSCSLRRICAATSPGVTPAPWPLAARSPSPRHPLPPAAPGDESARAPRSRLPHPPPSCARLAGSAQTAASPPPGEAPPNAKARAQAAAPIAREHMELPALHLPDDPQARQLRPAITPPSTSQIAPVTQPAFSERRNATTSATSCGWPTRPIG
jgi:hypothetical protein